MKIKDCMSRNVVSVGAQEPVSVAARLMSGIISAFCRFREKTGVSAGC